MIYANLPDLRASEQPTAGRRRRSRLSVGRRRRPAGRSLQPAVHPQIGAQPFDGRRGPARAGEQVGVVLELAQ